ncbi:unnamed protein product [Mycena citricolor]|uniref:Cytochrome P450 n=1 Tax=Mycena citricolor TaxID=2018698 RepID=A0AAD2JVA9_9AGAR|nr:unnamed protein product [Mycena citricolor]
MPTILHSLAVCTIISLCTALASLARHRNRANVVHGSLAGIRAVLDPPGVSKQDILRARAIANERLVHAFRLTNAFVSEDLSTYSEFVRRTGGLLRDFDWNKFAEISLDAVRLGLSDFRIGDEAVAFDRFVRVVTLRAVIAGLLAPDTDVDALDCTDLDTTAALINDLWVLSKDERKIPPALLHTLQCSVRRLLPDSAAFPNPLDLVIPTWETLGRLVAVTLALVHSDDAARKAFADLLEHPTRAQFCAPWCGGMAPSVESYSTEVLRLYPPVRRITRVVPCPSSWGLFLPARLKCLLASSARAVADIERAHRSAELFPDNPDSFDPSRFLHHPERAQELLSFGCRPMKCVGAKWAPMASAILTAAILSEIDGATFRVVEGPKIGGRTGWDRWMIQAAHMGTAK